MMVAMAWSQVRRETEGNPDLFFRVGLNLTGKGRGKDATPYFSYLDRARAAVATLIGVDVSDVVMVDNARCVPKPCRTMSTMHCNEAR